ncbi:PAS domain-containing protein [Shewanella sp. YLB-07]|uniref:PAS domain-containing protein n=1 Tax=Shewanella sp. YLB-07 TaxID=2601268 RepID=UPI00128B24C6|nr:PAS domain-containing protein [Shewanella sp. YLB-07]MPY24472.1 hypothetical protein [Shewanella sp. YLB-07]
MIALISKAISKLIPGQVEVIVHDLTKGRIVHIEGAFSNRQIGDESLINEDELILIRNQGNIVGPYEKIDVNKGKITSVSVLIEDRNYGDFMLCINMNVQPIINAMTELTSLINIVNPAEKNNSLIKNDWRESINNIIYKKLNDIGVSLTSAKKGHRQSLLNELNNSGFLQNKGAPEYVMKTLGISKATYYNLLKNI